MVDVLLTGNFKMINNPDYWGITSNEEFKHMQREANYWREQS